MNKIVTIIKKELKRFFSDKRMILSLILPGILIFVLYSTMGSFMGESTKVDPNEKYTVAIINESTTIAPIFSDLSPYNIDFKKDLTQDEAKQLIKDEELDLLIVFDEDFDEKISLLEQPNASVFYNSISVKSTEMYNLFSSRISALSMNISFNFFVNANPDISYDLATEEDISLMIVTMIAPFLLVIFLFSGCMSVATESIAGEKERGTIATLLVTPTTRKEIAIGKILSLSITSLFSSFISFIGLMASLPKMMNLEGVSIINIYDFKTYIGILLIIIVTIIFFTVIMSLVSIFAKSVKEAAQYSTPVMIAVMALAMPSMLGSNLPNMLIFYFVPVLNVVQCLSGLFSMSFNTLGFVITILSNIIYISIGVYLLIKMFDSEKIIFNK